MTFCWQAGIKGLKNKFGEGKQTVLYCGLRSVALYKSPFKALLTHFMSLVSLYTPESIKNTSRFLIPLEGIERNQ